MSNEWTTHKSGQPTPHPDTLIHVRFRDGRAITGSAGLFTWTGGTPAEMVHQYRIAEEQPAPAEPYAGGWLKHTGGGRPNLMPGVLVEVLTDADPMCIGSEPRPVKDWDWSLDAPTERILKYRVVSAPTPAEQSGNHWIEHKGEQPYSSDAPIEVQTRCGRIIRGGKVGDFYWGRGRKQRYAVERYRVVSEPVEQSSGGGDNDYYVADITNPKRLEPCRVECEDVIQALRMTFGEGEAFKAIWRGCAARIGNGKPGDTAIRNAEKVVHYGEYMKRDC